MAAPFVSLSGAVASLVAKVKPGKFESAVISVTNAGNVPATGSLQVVLSARPAGSAGSADVALATATAHVHILPGKSSRVHLRFLVPPTLPAASYALVAQLDPANSFNQSALPPVIVSSQLFTVA